MAGPARRPGTRLASVDTQETRETLVRPALWKLSGTGRGDEADGDDQLPTTRFRITLPTNPDLAPFADVCADEDDPEAWDDDAPLPASHALDDAPTPTRRARVLSLPRQRGVWAVCVTLLLITVSGLAFVAFPSSSHHVPPSTSHVIGHGAVSDAPEQDGALALGAHGGATVIQQTSPVSSSAGAPCVGPVQFPATIDTWTVPSGCYGLIYTPDPAKYIARPGFGYCNWWVRVMDPDHADITENTSYPRGSVPRVGAAVFFDGGVQGADPAGHWSRVEAIAPDGYWMLVSEMNFAWRGGGFGKVDYRFAHTGPGVTFIYA
ncbi:MAG: CHAP domain-containing protein [Ktedonobacterales bacterium]